MYKILSIDGGGVRGIIPATILAEIEAQTGKPIAHLFDLIVGTSTGGILACGLTVPQTTQEARQPKYKAQDLINLYFEESKHIFNRSFWRGVASLGYLFQAKYPISNLTKVLERYFGDAYISEAITELIVTSYDTVAGDNYFFKSVKAHFDEDKDFTFWQAASATSAAPSYFTPLSLKSKCLIDGGISMGNPAQEAINQALRKGIALKDILLVSLGTGETPNSYDYRAVSRWGLAEWVNPLIKMIFRSSTNKVDYAMRNLLNPVNYLRISPFLPKNTELDTADRKELLALHEIAHKQIDVSYFDITLLCKRLLQ